MDTIDIPPCFADDDALIALADAAAEKAARKFISKHPEEAARFPDFEAIKAAAFRGHILIGEGPLVPTGTDWATRNVSNGWVSSKEVSPGIWSECRFQYGKETKRWTTVLIA